jgi:hypothetical protein
VVKRGSTRSIRRTTLPDMAMGRRKDRARTPGLWIATNELPRTGGHPFYQRLNQVLDAHAFDAFAEAQCARFYADGVGRPGLTPGTYFRLLLIGYFEGIDSERGIAWRTADSLALRDFLGLSPRRDAARALDDFSDPAPERSGNAPRGLQWILQVLATADLVRGKTIGIDATTRPQGSPSDRVWSARPGRTRGSGEPRSTS